METARCPACGAIVRPSADWCSLCYYDLRRRQEPVASPVTAPPSNGPRARLVEAALEPDRSHWQQMVASHDIEDAEIVDGTGAPRVNLTTRGGSGTGGPAWPCSCGTAVSFGEDTCPDCGRSFLAELRDAGTGKHRRGAGHGEREKPRWLQSRSARLVLAGTLAAVLAFTIPLLLALVG